MQDPYIVWSTNSSVEFCYQQPQISSMWPTEGPVAGGTTLRLTGLNLQPSDKYESVALSPAAAATNGRTVRLR